LNNDVIISEHGEIHGTGNAPFRWVSYLTRKERVAVKEGQLVVVLGGSTHGGHPPYRKVVYVNNRYLHRVPSDDEQLKINKALKKL